MSIAADLNYVDRVFLNFKDSTYRWFDVKAFRYSHAAGDVNLLEELVRDRHYRDIYITADSHEHDSRTIHGPYLVSHIASSAFEKITPTQAKAEVDRFCDLFDSPPPMTVSEDIVAHVLSRVDTASSIYRLRDLEGADHELSHILDEFRELVVINHDQRNLMLIVMAID